MRAKLLTTIAGTAAAAYFLDPDEGRRRRHVARDRVLALFRKGSRKAERAGRIGAAYTGGYVERAKHAAEGEAPPADDIALADKVRTELFRPAESPKGAINVDAVDGVVTLRGEVKRPEDVNELERITRTIAGVRDVENLLHTPGSPAPNVAEVRGS